MSLVTEYCRRGECEWCDNSACGHMCHLAPDLELGPAGLQIIQPADDLDPFIPRPKGRR